MATYEPPTSNLAIFDPVVFQTNDEPLTIAEAKKRFLTFPTAQGAETLLDTTVVGSLALNQSLAKITLTGGTTASKSLIISENDKIDVSQVNNVVIGVGTCKSFTTNDKIQYSTIIGSQALSTTTSSGVGVASQTTAIGYQSLKNLEIGGVGVNTDNNVGCGSNSLVWLTGQSLVNSNSNTAVGTQSGANDTHKLINGAKNSFLGFNTGVSSTLSGTCNNSTAIGAESVITTSNQIQLGTVSEYVNIPNYIKFSDGSTQSTAIVGLVSITSFGAIGDGVFDCTTSINNAIATLSGGNKTLYIPQGKFKISGSLIFQGTNVGPSLTPLRNVNIFSEGAILATGSNYNAIYISNVDKFSINGNLVIDGTGSSGIIAVHISDVSNGAGGWYEAIFNLNISNISVFNCSKGVYVQSTGFSPKTYSDLIFYNVGIAVENRGEYNCFNNINATVGSIGILNYGGNNTYSNGMIKQYSYGAVVNYNASISTNPDHGGFYNMIFNHNGNCGIVVIYIDRSWTISNCNIYANGGGTLGDPLGNGTIPVAYQGLAGGGVYFGGVGRTNLVNNVIGLNIGAPLIINGSSGNVISNNIFYQVSEQNYIKVVGIDIYGVNQDNVISNNIFSGNIPATVPFLVIDNSIDATTLSKTTNFIMSGNNCGVLNYKNFNNVGTPTTLYIDGTSRFYDITEGQVDTLILTNMNACNQFTINYKRSGTFDYTIAPTFTDLLILQTGLGGINAVPVLCDGLSNTTSGGSQVIRFHKEGSYTFQPNINDARNQSGYYTVFPDFKDPQLYFTPTLNASTAINLVSPLFLNSVVNITTAIVSPSPNLDINLPVPAFSGSSSHYIGSTIQIFNNTNFVLTLNRSTSGNFKGSYGNDTTSITLPDNTWMTLTFDGTDYLINERSSNFTYQLTGYTVPVAFTSNFNLTNATVNLSTTSSGVVNIPVPSDTRCHQTTSIYNNIGIFQFTLTIASGTFSGKYGSGLTTLIVPINTWVQIYSDGTNWRVDNRSAENQFYYPTAFTSGTETISTNFQYINAELHLTSTFAGSVSLTLPAVSDAQTINQKYIIYNDNSLLSTPNSNPIVLTSTGTSYFRGIYQNNATGATQLTYTLGPNSNVEFYNNGTNWVITSIGEVGNQLTPIQTTAPNNPTVITRPFRKNYIISNAVGGVNQGFRLPVPLASDLGTEIFIRKGWNFPGTGSAFYLDNASTTAPPSTTNPVYTLLSTLQQPVVTSGNHLGNVVGGRFAVLQYGYAGTGTIAFVNTSVTCTVSLISTGAVISHYQPIVLTGAPVASVQVNERASGGGIGGNGTYSLSTAWTNPDASYSFTISDFYAWTQIQ